MTYKILTYEGFTYLATKLKSMFVKKDGDKVLSTNDYTNEDKQKLSGLNNYELPTASAEEKGGVKIGERLTMAEDTLSADPAKWADITDKPEEFKPETHTHKTADVTDIDDTIGTKIEAALGEKDYQTSTQVEEAITGKGYQTADDVEQTLTEKAYQNAEQVEAAITAKKYQTAEDVDSAITAKGYQTAEDVEDTLEEKGYQTSADVQAAIAGSTHLSREIVEQLPGTDAAKENTVYMKKKDDGGSGQDVYDEYLYISDTQTFEHIGSSDVDLTGYLKEDELTAITTEEIDSILSD